MFQSQQSQVGNRARCNQAHIQISKPYGKQTQPCEEHMPFSKKRYAAPCAMPRPARDYARKAIDVAADDVPERMTRQRIAGKQNYVHEQDQRANTNAKMSAAWRSEPKRSDRVIPENEEKDDGDVKKITMQVLQDEGETGFAAIAMRARLAHRASRRIKKESAIVSLPVVVAGGAKTERCPQN